MITLNKKLVTFKVTTDAEESSGVDSQFDDPTMAQWVHNQIEKGNMWAWFCASINASIKIGETNLTVQVHTGGCSYENEKDWLESDELSDMKNDALIYLQDKVNNLLDGLKDMERDQDMNDYLESNNL